jgi:hypothetical protein
MLVAVVIGFALVLLISACIAADVIAGRPRRKPGRETTIGLVTRVRGPFRGQVDGGSVPAEYIEVTAQYFTRQGDGPFETVRRLPVSARAMYGKGERVAISYESRYPRRGEMTGKIPSAA